MPFSTFTLEERPDLEEQVRSLDPKILPEFMHHDPINLRLWPRLYREFPAFQVAVCDERGEVAAAGGTIPVSFDTLPDAGWDAALEGDFGIVMVETRQPSFPHYSL